VFSFFEVEAKILPKCGGAVFFEQIASEPAFAHADGKQVSFREPEGEEKISVAAGKSCRGQNYLASTGISTMTVVPQEEDSRRMEEL
jgi:hypothetical protein